MIALIIQLFVIFILLLLFFEIFSFFYTSTKGAPFVPLKSKRVSDITQLIKRGDRVADLGCGNGQILIEAVKHGASLAEGWELDFAVYLSALWHIHRSGVDTKKIKLYYGDFWHANLTDSNLIYVYQMTKYLKPMKKKIFSQLKPGTLIVSPDYQIPGLNFWKFKSNLYLYKV
jgi:SAM-dependent methyltransferase